MFEQVLEPLIGVKGRAESRELAHGPQLSAVASRVNAARVRGRARKAYLGFIIEIWNAVWGVEALDRNKRSGGERVFTFRHSLERGGERTLFPFAFGLLQFIRHINGAHPKSPRSKVTDA